MEERNITVTLEKAKEWYNSGDATLQEIALQAFSRDEIKEVVCSIGWKNKMYVKANLMPYRIRITNIRIERLQDISEEDCLKEGIKEIYENGVDDSSEFYGYAYLPDATPCVDETYNYPQEAYAFLIDRISGKGTWESNPYVYVYDFELID